MTKKQAVRYRFRAAVMGRDEYRCRRCGLPGWDRQTGRSHPGQLVPLDAHHVKPRRVCPEGGYTADNGITLCDGCHRAEEGVTQ